MKSNQVNHYSTSCVRLIIMASLFRNATLWLFIITWLLVPSLQCEVICTQLMKVPPRWNYDGQEVPSIALNCEVSSECRLDINTLIKNYTDRLETSVYTSVDLYFMCTTEKPFGEYKHRF